VRITALLQWESMKRRIHGKHGAEERRANKLKLPLFLMQVCLKFGVIALLTGY
jgi:hypothetical protein